MKRRSTKTARPAHYVRGWMIAAGVAAAAASLAFSGCARHDATTNDGERAASLEERTPVSVTTVRALAGDGGVLAALPGRVEAREEVSIAARFPARLSRFAIEEGGSFRNGDLLAVFAAPETQKAVSAARATVDAAARQQEIARLQETRIDSLFAARVATRRELETVQAARRGTEAQLAAAEAALASLAADTEVRAPFDGVVVRRRVDPGAHVLPGAPLLDIRSLAVGAIVAPVPESLVDALASARLEYQIGNGAWRDARLVRLEGMIDPSTRTRMARFAPVDSSAALEAGAFARVRVGARDDDPAQDDGIDRGGAREDIVLGGLVSVPSESIVRRGGLRGVFVVQQGRARLHWVRAGRESGMFTEVLAGLAAGDEVVLAPAGLADGQPVHATAASGIGSSSAPATGAAAQMPPSPTAP